MKDKKLPPLEVKYRDVSELIPYVNNARVHSDEQVAQIAASIKEFGFNNPILTDGQNGVIAGHGRLLAAKKLGMKQVPVIDLNHLSENQKKAYILADNRLAENASWDYRLIQIELETLKENNYELNLTGFDLTEDGFVKGSEDETNEEKEKYTTDKVDPVHYEYEGTRPEISELYDDAEYKRLIGEIDNDKNLTEELRNFLKASATRFIKFDFKKIAEYYCHKDTPPQVQRYFEEQLLVIIDFDKAIERGYAKLNKSLQYIVDEALQEDASEENDYDEA